MVLNVIPLVLHRIVLNGCRREFEDVELSVFKHILDYCGPRITTINGGQLASAPTSMSYLLTFDDGYSSDVELVLPMLKIMKRSAIFFLIADMVNKSGYLSKTQVRELVSEGMVIGSHSFTHQDMRRLSASQQLEEFVASRNRIEDIAGTGVTCFSFPYGKFDSSLLETALECGYKYLFTSKHGIAGLNSSVFPRNSINGAMSWSEVRRTLRAEPITRLRWWSEDVVKSLIMNVVGDQSYRVIRKTFSGF